MQDVNEDATGDDDAAVNGTDAFAEIAAATERDQAQTKPMPIPVADGGVVTLPVYSRNQSFHNWIISASAVVFVFMIYFFSGSIYLQVKYDFYAFHRKNAWVTSTHKGDAVKSISKFSIKIDFM